MSIHVFINQSPVCLHDAATVAEALQAFGARPPFAVAVNTQFVPQSRHAQMVLHEGDRLEVISPVTGG